MNREESIERALDEQGIDRVYRSTLARLLDQQLPAWAPCCGSACEPCVLALRRAYERVLELEDPSRGA